MISDLFIHTLILPPVPTPTHPPDTPGTCPTGWLTSGNDCFLVKAGLLDLASFPEAQYLCKGYGAQLASIHTALENKIIFDAIFITATDVWLGMDRELDGKKNKNIILTVKVSFSCVTTTEIYRNGCIFL